MADNMQVLQAEVIRDESGEYSSRRRRIHNPDEALRLAMNKAERLFQFLQQRTGAVPADFFQYLQQRESTLNQQIEAAWKSVDNDIYSRYLAAELGPDEYGAWRDGLSRWLKILTEAVELYRLHRINIESDIRFEQRAA